MTQIRKIVKQITFNPRADGHISIIAEQGDINYYLTSATVLMREAKSTCNKAKLLQAMQMITLALAYKEKTCLK